MIASFDITSIGYEVDDKTKLYAQKKIARLDRYVPPHARQSMTADVKLRQVNQDHDNKYEAEVILTLPGKVITAKDSTLNMVAAIDIVEAKLIAQLRKYKTQTIEHL